MITHYRCCICGEYTAEPVLVRLDSTMGGVNPSVMVCPECADRADCMRLATERMAGLVDTIDAIFTHDPGAVSKLEVDEP